MFDFLFTLFKTFFEVIRSVKRIFPNIVKSIDFGIEFGAKWIPMELWALLCFIITISIVLGILKLIK